LFDTSNLEASLSQPAITIEGYELNRDDLQAFYAARNFRAAWDFSTQDQNTFTGFLDSLTKLVDYHGLEREDYPLDLMQKLGTATDADSKNQLELLVTDSFIKLAHDLHGDTLDLHDLYPGWNFERTPVDIPTTLAAAVSGNSVNEYFESLAPKNPVYGKLATALATYRGYATTEAWPQISPGPSIKPKEHNPRVAQLRARLEAEGYLPQAPISTKASESFTPDVEQALIDYQTLNGLATDGAVGSKTLEALNTPLPVRIDQIRANMERWRHMPDDFPPERYTLVNIPDAAITITEDGKVIYKGIVIVGRVDRKTPFIQSNIRSMLINPSWHVPAKIARKDILPKLREDPHYLEKQGIVIKDSNGDPYGDKIDWQTISENQFNFKLRQMPGDLNSLGRLKFDFDNDFAVYMHGTPHQELFKKNERSLSSGCVRLHDPEEVAQIFMSHNKETWDIPKLEDSIKSNKTHWVAVAQPMPLDIVYWTVFTDDEGRVNFRKDVYDYDSFLIANMKGEGTGKAMRLDQGPDKH
ncbi:MAG TPA: L,D-transpeptidase family protein, partial [Alphaproteobacteria bacterium]|nr:L,D-transpeptidase family protein [Alphaproteobacteria bacterium]